MLSYKNAKRIPRDGRETVRINKQLKEQTLNKYIKTECRANVTFSDLIEMLLQQYNNEMKNETQNNNLFTILGG